MKTKRPRVPSKARTAVVLVDELMRREPQTRGLTTARRIPSSVRVTDDEVEAAMRHFFTDTHNVVEGAGAAGLAASLQEKEQLCEKRVAVVATGANVDRDVFARVLMGESL